MTIASLEKDVFEVVLVPHTLSATTFSDLKAGSTVNIETDVIGKYVRRYLETGRSDGFSEPTGESNSGLDEDKLRRYGFI